MSAVRKTIPTFSPGSPDGHALGHSGGASQALGPPAVTFAVGTGVVIRSVTIDAPEVVAEAMRWTTGRRADAVDPGEAEGADLTDFHRTALCLGSRVLQATADSTTAISLAATVSELAQKAEGASANLVEGAMRASTHAVEAASRATRDVTEATGRIVDSARERFHNDVTGAIAGAMETVQQELDRLLSGEENDTVTAIHDVVSRAMSEAQVTWHRSLTTTLTEVTRTLDVNNPSSPLGALERRLAEQHERQHGDLTNRLDRVQEMVVMAASTATTAAAVAAAHAGSPAKGRPFQEAAGTVLEAIASGLAAGYTDTSDAVGSIRNCKKGDAVIEMPVCEPGASAARVVVEFTTQGQPRNWSRYLDVAERNRGAHASLGIVPSRAVMPGLEIVAILGANRMVVAFDPDEDDVGILKAAVQLLALQAQRRLAEGRSSDLGAVDSKLEDARRRLLELQEIIKTALAVRNGAGKVVTGLEALHGGLTIAIDQARGALSGAMLAGSSAA